MWDELKLNESSLSWHQLIVKPIEDNSEQYINGYINERNKCRHIKVTTLAIGHAYSRCAFDYLPSQDQKLQKQAALILQLQPENFGHFQNAGRQAMAGDPGYEIVKVLDFPRPSYDIKQGNKLKTCNT